jgi:hypothetical protein
VLHFDDPILEGAIALLKRRFGMILSCRHSMQGRK